MIRSRRKFSPSEKARIALEAIKGIHTINEIALKHNVHPTQVNKWRKELLTRLPEVFKDKRSIGNVGEHQKLIDELYKQIGQLTVERDWLKKKSEFFS